MKPLVSVILTVYNTEKYISQCLNSLISQTLQEIEIICIDDCSMDKSVDILRRYQNKDKRIRLILLDKNNGANYARNLALKKVKGKYVAILDGDDFFRKDFLKKLYTQAQKTNADITFCGFDLFDNNTRNQRKITWDIDRRLLPKDPVFSMKPQLFNILPSFVWNQLYSVRFIRKNELLFANVSGFTDVYFNKTALLRAKRISYVDEKLAYYRFNNFSSISNNLNALDGIRTLYQLQKFLKSEGIHGKYKHAFFDTSLQKMNRVQKLCEPYRSLVRSFYQKYLIPKLDKKRGIPDEYNELKIPDTCSNLFKYFFFNKRDNIIPIVLSGDENTVPMIAVQIESVKMNMNPDYFYDIYILESDLSPVSRFNLVQLSAQNMRVTCLNVAGRTDKSMKKKYCLLIPTLFKGYNRVLYLENTILVQSDLTDFLTLPLNNQLIAGIFSPLTFFQKIRYIFHYHIKPDNFLNSCILLWNISYCKKQQISESFIECNQSHKRINPTASEIITYVCRGKVTTLPERMSIPFFKGDEHIIPKSTLINYLFKPWLQVNNPASQNWLQTARHSIFYEFFVRYRMK